MGLVTDTIVAEIVDRYEAAKKRGLIDTQAYNEVADAMGIDASSVRYHVKALKSTVALAKRKLLAKASVMVDRIVEKAPTSELIDILSRPNIGVLDPAQKGQQGNGGFFLSVEMGSLGGVRATAAMLPESAPALPPASEIIDITGDAYAQNGHVPTSAEALRYRLALARAGTGEGRDAEAASLDTPADDAEVAPAESDSIGPRSRTPWLEREDGRAGHV